MDPAQRFAPLQLATVGSTDWASAIELEAIDLRELEDAAQRLPSERPPKGWDEARLREFIRKYLSRLSQEKGRMTIATCEPLKRHVKRGPMASSALFSAIVDSHPFLSQSFFARDATHPVLDRRFRTEEFAPKPKSRENAEREHDKRLRALSTETKKKVATIATALNKREAHEFASKGKKALAPVMWTKDSTSYGRCVSNIDAAYRALRPPVPSKMSLEELLSHYEWESEDISSLKEQYEKECKRIAAERASLGSMRPDPSNFVTSAKWFRKNCPFGVCTRAIDTLLVSQLEVDELRDCLRVAVERMVKLEDAKREADILAALIEEGSTWREPRLYHYVLMLALRRCWHLVFLYHLDTTDCTEVYCIPKRLEFLVDPRVWFAPATPGPILCALDWGPDFDGSVRCTKRPLFCGDPPACVTKAIEMLRPRHSLLAIEAAPTPKKKSGKQPEDMVEIARIKCAAEKIKPARKPAPANGWWEVQYSKGGRKTPKDKEEEKRREEEQKRAADEEQKKMEKASDDLRTMLRDYLDLLDVTIPPGPYGTKQAAISVVARYEALVAEYPYFYTKEELDAIDPTHMPKEVVSKLALDALEHYKSKGPWASAKSASAVEAASRIASGHATPIEDDTWLRDHIRHACHPAVKGFRCRSTLTIMYKAPTRKRKVVGDAAEKCPRK